LNELRGHIRLRGLLSGMYRGIPAPDWIGGSAAVSAGQHPSAPADDDPNGLLRKIIPGIGTHPFLLILYSNVPIRTEMFG
jgi:hypothetical protein